MNTKTYFEQVKSKNLFEKQKVAFLPSSTFYSVSMHLGGTWPESRLVAEERIVSVMNQGAEDN